MAQTFECFNFVYYLDQLENSCYLRMVTEFVAFVADSGQQAFGQKPASSEQVLLTFFLREDLYQDGIG
jgi:hypothetical protein